MRKSNTMLMAALTFTLGFAPAAFCADELPPPPEGAEMMPPPGKGKGGMGGMGGMMGGKGGMGGMMQNNCPMCAAMREGKAMPDEQREAGRKVMTELREAEKNYRDNPSDETLAALKEKVGAMVDFRQKMSEQVVERMLEQVKAETQNRDQLVERQLKQIINRGEERREGMNREGREGRREGRREGMNREGREERREGMNREGNRGGALREVLTSEEKETLNTLQKGLRDLDPKSDEAKAKVKELNEFYTKTLERVKNSLNETDKSDKKEVVKLERSIKVLENLIKQTSTLSFPGKRK